MTLGTGFIAAGVAAVGFGSNFVPAKKYDMGDGMMFQMIMALGVWITGLIYAIFQSLDNDDTVYFHPIALLGGVIWAAGNICTVPIIKTIGMALGLAIWSSTSIVIGWITGKFGILGTPKDHTVHTEWLNYVGICIILCSLVAFFQVSPSNDEHEEEERRRKLRESQRIIAELPKTETHIFNPAADHLDSQSPAVADKRFKFVNQTSDLLARRELELEMEHIESWIDKLDTKHQVILGVVGSIFSGICYGLVFCPIQYDMNHHKNDPNYPQTLEKYAFCHFSGILISATFLFMIYAIRMKNQPQTSHETILPSLASGLIWGVAQIAFFVAQDPDNLGTETSFPIVASSPQIVASFWGVAVFKEVTGGKSLMKLVIAISIEIVGIVCIALSKTST